MSTIAQVIKGLEEYSRQMADISKAVGESFLSSEWISSIIDAQMQWRSSLEPIVQAQLRNAVLAENLRSFADQVANISKTFQPVMLDITRQIDTLVSPAFFKFFEGLQQLPDRVRAALMTLGNHGWFFDLEMPLSFLWEIAQDLEAGRAAAVDDALAEYFRERLPSIRVELDEMFPHRVGILDAAFRAHERGEYELSVPVFLTQTDGICHELTNAHFFIRRDGKPSTAAYVQTMASNTLRHALLFPLSQPTPISASQRERGQSFSELNRHQVLHGEVLDYGTETNSLKSISLLNYVARVLCMEHEIKDQ